MSQSVFKDDWDFQVEMRPAVDTIYRQVWGNDILIERADSSRYLNVNLDRLLAVDVRIRRSTGLVLTGQEKSRRPQGKGSPDGRYYGDLTVEYYQNPKHGEEGDWFRFGGQWYFCGIATPALNAFRPWVVVDWRKLQDATHRGYIRWRIHPNKEHGKSNFAATKIRHIPPDVVIASSYPYHINLGPLFNGWPRPLEVQKETKMTEIPPIQTETELEQLPQGNPSQAETKKPEIHAIPIETWIAHHQKRGVVLRGPDGRVIDWLWCLATWDRLGRPVVYAAPGDPFYDLSLYMYPERLSPQKLQGILTWLEEQSGERQQ